MSNDLNIRCNCGSFQAVAYGITPDCGTHLTCYCDDCQAFQHFLGSPERVLDANGGTEIFQMSAGRLKISSGDEHLACVRFGPKSPLRWYAGCCNAAIGNTLATPALPFIGLITAGVDRANDDEDVARALGPRRRGVFGRFAYGDRTRIDAYDKASIVLVPRFLSFIIRWRLRGDHKKSPLFDAATGAPVKTPQVLSKTEREQLKQRQREFAAPRSA